MKIRVWSKHSKSYIESYKHLTVEKFLSKVDNGEFVLEIIGLSEIKENKL